MGIMIIMAPEKIPAEPKPAMARPRMKTGEVGAPPQMAEPTSKMTIQARKTLEYSCQSPCQSNMSSHHRAQTYHFML